MGLSAIEKRELVVSKIKSREKKNTYSLKTNLRTKVGTGFGDCSSTVAWAYKESIGMDIGGYTPAQYANTNAIDVDKYSDSLYPNIENLIEGDLIFFAGNFSNDREVYDYVGHVEMYIGEGKIMGHGSGIGPKIKGLKDYCKGRGEKNHYLKTRRFILDEDDKAGDTSNNKISNSPVEGREDSNTNNSSTQTNNNTNKNTNNNTNSKNNVLKYGSKGNEVEELQRKLKFINYNPKGADGNFGINTEKAVIAFQKANGLEADGIVGPKTKAKIDKLLKQKMIKDAKKQGTTIVVNGATLKCTNGTIKTKLKVPKSHGAKIQGENEATIKDNKVNINITSFGKCKARDNHTCNPVIGNTWKNSKSNFKLNNVQALTKNSCLACNNCGIITIVDDGQKKSTTEEKAIESEILTFKTTRKLKYGSKGEDVVQLQKVLNKFKCGNLIPDGKYGTKTKNAVIAFQKKYGLKPDGIVGPKTKAKIAELLKKEKESNKTKSDKKDTNTTNSSNNKKETTKKESTKKETTKKEENDNKTESKEDNNNDQTKYLENLKKNTLNFSKEKLNTLCVAAEVLLKEDLKLAFVSGMLGNIAEEGSVGKFENSNYRSNPEKKPDYLIYVDDNFGYRNKFSGKNISQVGIKATYELVEKCEDSKYKGKFGLGCVQWTGERCTTLVNWYVKSCGQNAYPTTKECANVESNFIVKELKSSYKGVYTKWCNANNGGVDSSESARSAGILVCKDYEKPKADSSTHRGDVAKKIYKAMKG